MSEKAKRLRSTQLHFYVNDQELDLIRTKMKQVGTDNMSSYLRKMAVDGYVIRLDMKELRELTRLLGNMAGSENQIAKRVNETGTVYAEDLEEIKKNQEEIKESVNKILQSLADLPYKSSEGAQPIPKGSSRVSGTALISFRKCVHACIAC